jgi:hypothetical protein
MVLRPVSGPFVGWHRPPFPDPTHLFTAAHVCRCLPLSSAATHRRGKSLLLFSFYQRQLERPPTPLLCAAAKHRAKEPMAAASVGPASPPSWCAIPYELPTVRLPSPRGCFTDDLRTRPRPRARSTSPSTPSTPHASMTPFDGFPDRQLELAAVFLFSRECLPSPSRSGRRPSPPSPPRGSHQCHDALQPLHRHWRPVVQPPTGDPLLQAATAAACSLVRAMPRKLWSWEPSWDLGHQVTRPAKRLGHATTVSWPWAKASPCA